MADVQNLIENVQDEVLQGQAEGITGSHQNWRSGETREGAALKETTKHTGNGNSKGPTREQRGPAAPKTQTSNSNPTARRCSTRAQWRVKHHQAAGQSTTSQGGSQPVPQGNPQGVPSQNRQLRLFRSKAAGVACSIP